MLDRWLRGWSNHVGDLGDATSAGAVQKWLVGVVFALLLGNYAVQCLLDQSAVILGIKPLRIVEVRGTEAIALGALFLSAAVFTHCHWFWSDHPRFYGYAQLGKILSLLAAIGSLGAFFYHIIVLG